MSKNDLLFDPQQILHKNRLVGLWHLLSRSRWLYLVAIICVGLGATAQMGFYYLIRFFTDEVLVNESQRYLLPYVALAFIGLALIQGFFTFISGRWVARVAERVAQGLRDYMYDHIQRLSFAYHDKTPTGDLIQRATSDIDALRRLLAEQAIGIGWVVMRFTINFTAIWVMSSQLALLSVVIVPFVLLTAIFFFKRISDRYEEFQAQEAKLSTTLQENLSGIRVVRAFARQPFEQDKFEEDNWEKFKRGKRLIMMHAIYWPSTDLIVAGQLLLSYFVAATMAINGTISVGTYIAYMGLLGWIIWPIRHLGRLVVDMSKGLVSFDRIRMVLREDREPLDEGSYHPSAPLKGDIRFENVAFAYEGESDATVLHDLSFHCPAGKAVALVGGTGSGKTSLINLLPRFYEYTGGSIQLDGVELNQYPRTYLRRQIGLVQQEPFLFSRTIRSNITYGVGRDVSDEEVEAAARAAVIHDVILTFPDGYNTLVGEKGVTLSGGQKQRLTLARTLLQDPRILVLDDATSSVDTETEAAIRDALEQLIPGRTTFIIAHRIQTVMNADLILVLQNGRVVQCGDHDTLITQDGIYQEIFNLQSRIEDELEAELALAM